MRYSVFLSALSATILVATAATAQDKPATPAAAPSVGASVYGPDGDPVGVVESVSNGIVTVNTGTTRAGLPATAIATREKGLTISMNKAQLEAAAGSAHAQSDAARDAATVAGASIASSDGVTLGTIAKAEGEDVTLQLASGATVMIRKSNLGLVNGKLALGMTADAFNSQVAASTPPPAAVPSEPATTPSAGR